MSSSQTLELNSQEAHPQETCPRCHTVTEWGENSWCPDCGYYPVVDGTQAEGTSWADGLPDAPEEEFDDRSALASIPMWFWLMIAGIIGIALSSVWIRHSLADQETLRGRIALGQLGVGLLIVMVAHGLAAKFAMAGDRRISIPDIFLSWFNIWQPTIGKLPHTCRRLLAVVWGMLACLTAVTIIGGIDYGYPFRDHKGVELRPMDVANAVASAAKAQAQKNGQEGKSLEEAIQSDDLAMTASAAEAGGTSSSEKSESMLASKLNELPADKDKDGIQTVTGSLYGVVTDQRNVPVALLFAVKFEDKWIHFSRVTQKGIPSKTFRRIIQKLNGKVTKGPFVDLATVPDPAPNTRQAWVRFHVDCSLKFTRMENGELANVRVHSILINQPGVLSSLSR